MEIQLSESLTKINLTDLKWAIDKRYVEPDSIWVGLNIVSIVSCHSPTQINKMGYVEITGKRWPAKIKNNWSGNWQDLVYIVSKIVNKPLEQVNYQLRRFSHMSNQESSFIRFRNFSGYEVFAQQSGLQKDWNGAFYLYDYHPVTHKLRPIPMQLLKECFIEYESRCL